MKQQARIERNMRSMAFDTLKTAKRLGEAGFEVAQAESLADILGESVIDKLATKDDLGDLEKRLSREIKTLDTKIDTVEDRLTAKIDQVDERLTAKIDQVDERLTAKIDQVNERLSAKIDQVDERLSAKIDQVDERLSAKIDQVDERLSAKIDQVDERLSAKIDHVEERLTAKIEKQGIDVGKQIADLKADIAVGQNSLQRWMIGLIISLFIGVGGMILVYFAS